MSTNSKPVHAPSKRPPRKSSRPATAPAKEDVALLPSLQSSDRKQLHFLAPNNSNMQTLNEDDAASDSTNSLPTTPFEPAMGLGLATSTSNTGSMYDTPMLYKDSPEIVSSSSTLSSLTQSTSAMSMYKQSTAYDWSVFMSAYASGRWDPHKTPNPPAGGSPSMRMLGAMPVDMASTNIALAVNTGSGEIDSAEIDQASLRTTTDRNSPYLKSVPTHRMRNSFSTSSSLSNSRKHISSVPLGLSHSAGTSSAAVEPPNSSQKAKGGLFLNLPSLGLGLDPSPIVSPHNVALQSNALYSNSHHDEVRYTSKYVTPSESAAPAPRPTPPLPLSLSKSSPSSQASITGGYPATATAGSFTPYHLPAQFHPNHNANATHHNGSSSSATSSYPPKTHYATSSSSSRPARDFRYPDFPHAPAINAATLRLAGTHVNISPLALPSPEHELTDPMRAAVIVDSSSGRVARDAKLVVTVPGTVPDDIDNISEAVVVRGEDGSMSDGVLIDDEVIERMHSQSSNTDLKKLAAFEDDEAAGNKAFHDSGGPSPEFTNDIMTTPGGTRRRIRISQELKKFWEGTIPTLGEFNSSSVYSGIGGMYEKEAQPKGKTPKRQSPEIRKTEGHDDYFTRGREFSVASSSSQARLAMPDHIQGELADPTYRFNIWHTGSDLNFDRIAHLAKLVFNTKGVFISLLDGNEQWFKSEWGLKVDSCARLHSFCGHAILQRDDEPMVILDTLQDWRFANNPHVVNSPHIRFYAGAPLRTQDGHNIGSLAVIDDTRRDEFTPRHRHTLKEFAAIAMREMELWRDKIQLRIRDRIQNSMEQFSRECLEIDMEHPSQQSLENGITDGHSAQSTNASPNLSMTSSMDRVYDRAAKLVQRTLDVEGVIVMDVSHCEVLENMSGESTINVVMHHGDPDVTETTTKSLTAEEYAKLNAFFAKYPDGRVSEGIVPPSIRLFLPTTRIQYALTVPIFNIDKRPFALLCAYNVSDHTKRFLEGHELSYLRAIGVIILSAVLKRRMLLADKAKSLFISNISHELRTPLHGILAAAELLGESDLNHAQESFLQTVKACGTSLVETVNHVLDFTKLSGNSKAGGVENVIIPTKVDLMELIEEAVDGCWIGHRARTATMEDTGIGSVYSPPAEDENKFRKHVEAVIDIGDRREGWLLRCEKGGIRRVLMNVFGNSLKFTSDGFVHVVLRQLPLAEGDPPNKIKIELSVHDTGKGISQNFLKNQLFHPFSQENPLQTGTGLGLAIVNSIVTSDSVGGKVDVWSEENVGTEIKVTFLTEVAETGENPEMGALKLDDFHPPPSVSLVGFESDHRGIQLLHSVLKTYMTTWWGLEIQEDENELGNIVVLNEDVKLVVEATSRRDTSRPFIVLSASRGNPIILSVAHEYELIGGFCRIIYKPGGPSRIRSALRLCLHALKIGAQNGDASTKEEQRVIQQSSAALLAANLTYPRRYSEDSRRGTPRPSMSPRSTTVHPTTFSSWTLASSSVPEEKPATPDPDNNEPTITLDSGGTLLKSSIGSIETKAPKFRVLVIEDNLILRTLIVKWLTKKGYDFRDAVDGRDGVNVYTNDGPFDIVLLDLSMPVLDGIGATAEIRKIETSYRGKQRCRILALTGMSSLDDKRRAFDAGVDGYLVKPVPFSTLNEVFHKLGIS
ncbi:hypothetical protein BDP27DRAFT_1333985 [Rhodocollybia butyracea]|uniref:histidine kinase n=1 Tax=Rhodocollybia butyracea TaxID=206335 RepID=A0A9P5PLK7_9AGAR|nr:hypothetical protein BDP27DRAFT_1333985 [Rhodocollybia butyracea]